MLPFPVETHTEALIAADILEERGQIEVSEEMRLLAAPPNEMWSGSRSWSWSRNWRRWRPS